MELLLVVEAFGGDADHMVAGEINVLKISVELEGGVDGFDLVVPQDEALYGRVEGDRKDI